MRRLPRQILKNVDGQASIEKDIFSLFKLQLSITPDSDRAFRDKRLL